MIRVAIADDHAILRDGLRRVLEAEEDIRVEGEAANGAECLELLRRIGCEVLLLDIAMPGRDGLGTLQQVHQEWPQLAVLILSQYPESLYAVRMFKAGASGYLSKETDVGQLLGAVRKLAGGKKFISPTVAELLADSLDCNMNSPHHSLSNRELQILMMMASGKSVAHIAEELSLSAKTISTYRSRMLKKMHLHSTAELMHYSIRHALLDNP